MRIGEHPQEAIEPIAMMAAAWLMPRRPSSSTISGVATERFERQK